MLGELILRMAPMLLIFGTVFYSGEPLEHTAAWEESWTRTYELTAGETLSEEEIGDVIYFLQKNAEAISAEAAVYRRGSSAEGNPVIEISLPGAGAEAFAQLDETPALEFVSAMGEPEEKVWLDEACIADAEAAVLDNMGIPDYSVKLTFTEEGAGRFAEATSELIGDYLYIIYNGECISAPMVNEAITGGTAMISGLQSETEANRMAALLRVGALNMELREIPKG